MKPQLWMIAVASSLSGSYSYDPRDDWMFDLVARTGKWVIADVWVKWAAGSFVTSNRRGTYLVATGGS